MANIYSTVDVATMKRSTFNRKVPHKCSIPFGKWMPVGKVQEVLPHDTWRLDSKGIIRMLTPLVPIMDDISFDVVSFFVPYTIVWSKAKQFFGENDQVAWDLVQNVDFPKVTISCPIIVGPSYNTILDAVMDNYDDEEELLSKNMILLYDSDTDIVTLYNNPMFGTLLDAFGLPVSFGQNILVSLYTSVTTEGSSLGNGVYSDTYNFFKVNALPFRANQLIYNNWFRNQNVTDPMKIWVYDDNDTSMSGASGFGKFNLMPAVRWKDMFTACLKEPQRGPSVGLPIAGEANVVYDKGATGAYPTFKKVGTTTKGSGNYLYQDLLTVGGSVGIQASDTAGDPLGNSNRLAYDPDGSLRVDLSTVTMATINQIRYAFATQRYYEKLARGGALYRDYVRVMFGVTPSDLSIQIPQLLGSKHFHININQVLATAETLNSSNEVSNPVGSTGAVSATGFSDHIFTNSFSQHGMVLTYICIRKEHTYCQGLDKFWTKEDAFDIYNPTFAHIGEVPVLRKEIYYDPTNATNNEQVFGYNEAWYEYRYDRPIVTGLLNPLNPGSGQLSAFTLVDVLGTYPTLSNSFIQEDPNGLDRSLVAGASSTHQFIADLLMDYQVARVMPVHSTPGLLDHF